LLAFIAARFSILGRIRYLGARRQMFIAAIVVPVIFASPAGHTGTSFVPIKGITARVPPPLAIRVTVRWIKLPVSR
jgi:hypothetical protein